MNKIDIYNVFILTCILIPCLSAICLMYALDLLSTSVFIVTFTIVLGLASFLVPIIVKAESFTYKNGLSLEAVNYKAAARQCYSRLTNNRYPGEEAGLQIIDVCANPINQSKRMRK